MGGLGRFRFRPDFSVFCKPLISAEQVRGSRLPWFCPGSGGSSRAGRRSGGGRTSSGGGYCCWWRGECWRSGGGKGFLPENRGGFPSPYLQSSWKQGSRRLAAGWAARLPPHSLPARPPAEALPPTALPGGAELDSSLRRRLRARPGSPGGPPGGGREPESSLPSRAARLRPSGGCLSSFHPSPKSENERSAGLPELSGRRS